MKIIKNNRGNWPLAIAIVIIAPVVLYLLFAFAVRVFDEVGDWLGSWGSSSAKIAESDAKTEQQRISMQGAQFQAVMAQNARLIDENSRTVERIEQAHEMAAGEIAGAHKTASMRLMEMADRALNMKTDKTLLYLLAAVAISAVLGLSAVVVAMILNSRRPDGPVILNVEGYGLMSGRITSGKTHSGDFRLIENRFSKHERLSR